MMALAYQPVHRNLFPVVRSNAWAILKAYLDATTAQAAEPVSAKYLGELTAADMFTVDNALTLVQSLRLDLGVLGPQGIHP